MHGFRFYFTLHLESFSPFPHGTCSLSVTREYLALQDGPRRFPPDFTCPVVLGCLFREPTRFRLQGYHLLWPGFPTGSTSVLVFDSPALRRIDPATPPHASVLGFRLIRFRSPLLTESNFLSLPRGTEMSHFPPLASCRLLNSADDDGTSSRRVSPFGHPRVEDCLRLTEAYRSLPRPSSPSRAKASTVHP